MSDSLDNLAENFAERLINRPKSTRHTSRDREKVAAKRAKTAVLLSKIWRGTKLSTEEQETINKSPLLKGKTASDLLSEATGTLSLSGKETQDLYSSFTKQQELLKAAASKAEEDAERAKETGSPVQPWWESGKGGSMMHDTAPDSGSGSGSGPNVEQQSVSDIISKGQPSYWKADLSDVFKPEKDGPYKTATPVPTSRQTVLDKARETLKGDTYQLGSSSYLTAAREMKKPTPFTQRTDEQVTAANVVGRERIAGRERQAKADALGRARSRMRDVATAQKGAQQFFEDTGVTPKQVRALSGERMPERRRTYEAPRDPNVVRTEAPSKKFAGKTNVSYKSFSPNEVNEIEKKRRRNR